MNGFRWAVLSLLLCGWTAKAGEVRGVVVDARGGETLARVRVQLVGTSHQASTDSAGRFTLSGVPAGDFTLHVETVGYRLLKRDFTLADGEEKEFQIVLSPDTFRRTDSVSVQADPFELAQAASPSELSLSDTEIKNLGTVLVDDPVRAVQSLPGVVANNDYYAQFSVYAAPYSTIGFYLDGVLLHSPFHTVEGINDSGSLSILSGDSIEHLSLMPLAFSSEYGDRIGSAVDAQTREGSRTKPSVRVAASVAQANVMAEGPLDKSKRGSWLVSARKSYSQYVAGRLTDDPAQAFGYTDQQGKLTYDLTPRQTVTLHIMNGQSEYDQSGKQNRLGVNSLMLGDYHMSLAQAGWRWTPAAKLLFNVSGAYMREKYGDTNKDGRPLDTGFYNEWIGSANAAWYESGRNAFEAGWSVRRLRSDGSDYQYVNVSNVLRILDRFRGTGVRQGGYAQQSWYGLHGRLRLSAGVRFDSFDAAGPSAVSPHASAGFGLTQSTQLDLGWGQYVQYPELQIVGTALGGTRMLPMRSNHVVAGIDQRLGRMTRVRVEAYQRENRDGIARPLFDPRLVGGRVVLGAANPLYYNSIRGYSRGIQVMVQSRTANRLSGWVAYTLGYARDRDGVENTNYWDPQDQRHTVNVYGSYRLRPSVNLSGKVAYGSGNPMPGFFRTGTDGLYYLAPQRNEVRLADYARADFRVNKSFIFDRWKLTLYGELINGTNHKNPRFTSYNGVVDSKTGRVSLTIQRVFPILPSGGVMLEF